MYTNNNYLIVLPSTNTLEITVVNGNRTNSLFAFK